MRGRMPMFMRPYRLFSLFGFDVKLDPTWLVLGAVITWSLSLELFPAVFPWLSPPYWFLLGLLGSLGLAASVLAHELGHALMARRGGIRIDGITLFLLGGVAELRDEPSDPAGELRMAAAGPAVSLLLALLCAAAGSLSPVPEVGRGLLFYLALVNLLLGAFNLLPAFPLDGGRMLRAVLWRLGGDRLRATQIAAGAGVGFAVVIGFLGLYTLVMLETLGGLWWLLLALFLREAAHGSYRQAQLREALRGEPIGRLMRPAAGDPGRPELPGPSDERVPACSLAPDVDALEALAAMARSGAAQLTVVENGRAVGVVLRPDLVRYAESRIARPRRR